MRPTKPRSIFSRFANWTARTTGRPATFWAAAGVVVLWLITGPFFHFSDTWQLVINTATTIVTFLMVFLIQSTQNRDSEAIQIKLDELIRSIHGAQNKLLNLEELEEADLDEIREEYLKLAERARGELQQSRRAAKKKKLIEAENIRGFVGAGLKPAPPQAAHEVPPGNSHSS